MSPSPEQIFSFDNFELNTNTRALTKDGTRVPLKPKSFDLLLTLVENRGRVLRKEELLDRVWKDRFIEENNLTVHIAALRKALGETRGDCRYIVTVPNEGYKFAANVTSASFAQLLVENHKRTTIVVSEDTSSAGSMRHAAMSKGALALAALLVITAIGYAALSYFSPKPGSTISSVAVLPFENGGGSEDSAYLSDGLAEGVIYSLSRAPGLRVMSRNSTFRYSRPPYDAQSIGSDLNVDAIVTGRVSTRGDECVVSVELISAKDNSAIWGKQFSRRMTELSRLQPDITESISDLLRRRLENRRSGQTDNSVAYDLYLRGRYLLNRRTTESIRQSIDLFEQALARDPNFAEGHEALGIAHQAFAGNNYWPRAVVDEHRAKSKAALLKALEVDPTLSEARGAVAFIKADQEWDFVGAENEFRRAIESDPNMAIVHQWYSQFLARMRRFDEALAEVEAAQKLDPFSRSVRVNLGRAYGDLGRYDDAIVEFNRLIEHDPEYPWAYMLLSELYQKMGKLDESIDPLFRGRTILGLETEESAKSRSDSLRQALNRDGARGYWLEALQHELDYYRRDRTYAIAVAGIYARLGDRDRTIEWLEKEFSHGDRSGMTYMLDEIFDRFRDDKDYVSLTRRVGLNQ